MLVARPEQFDDPGKFVLLWLHESERVYGDRLVSNADLKKYNQLALAIGKKKFGAYAAAISSYFSDTPDQLIFCHYTKNIQDKMYDQATDFTKLSGILDAALQEYNETNANMDLVLFTDAIKHITRITRIILNPAGHALLVGVGGSGKQSLSRLSSFICNYTLFQIVISSTYGINDLKEDLQKMYMRAGAKDEGVTFLFTDSQITKERFLVYVEGRRGETRREEGRGNHPM